MLRLVLVLLLLSGDLYGFADHNYIAVHDLKSEWLDTDGLEYDKDGFHRLVRFGLRKGRFMSGDQLQVVLPTHHTLFLADQLILQTNEQNRRARFDLDSLFRNHSSGRVDVVVLADVTISESLQTQIIRRQRILRRSEHQYINILYRDRDSRSLDSLITKLLLVLIIVVIYRTVQTKTFIEYFSMSRLFTLRPKMDSITSISIYSLSNQSYLILYAFLVAMAASVLSGHTQLEHIYNRIGMVQPDEAVVFVHFMFGTYTLMLFKYPSVRIIANLFYIRRITDIHYYSYFRVSLLFSTLLFVVSIFFVALGVVVLSPSLIDISQKAFILLVLARSLYVYLILNRQLSFHKLHLFIYLCATEIIPQVLLLKLLL